MDAKERTANTLRIRAEQADARYSETIKSRTNGKRDRWTLTAADEAISEIAAAYRDKLCADEAWLMFLRTSKVLLKG